MVTKNDKYTYRITWSEDDTEYVGLCAEFPSLSWLAETPEKALKGIRNLVAEVLLDMGKTMSQFQSQSQASISAGNLWSGCLQRYIENWLYKLLNPA